LTVIDASDPGVLSLVATDLAGIPMPWLNQRRHRYALLWTGGARSLVKYPLLILVPPLYRVSFVTVGASTSTAFHAVCEADLRDRVFTHLQKLRSLFPAR